MNYLGLLCSCQANDLPKPTKGVISILDLDEGQPCLNCTKERCLGYRAHSWRNVCVHCNCPRNGHDIVQTESVDIRDRLGWDPPKDPSLQANKEKSAKFGYKWIPPGLTKQKVEEYMKQLGADKAPRLSTSGARYRDLQLTIQLPPHDLSSSHCRHLANKEQKDAFDEFCRVRDTDAMDIGYIANGGVKDSTVCRGCDGKIEPGELAVLAPRVSTTGSAGTALWHPACFVCSKCKELLVDLCYCLKDGAIYCERHYAELVRPRCASCDELVFGADCTKAMSRSWHPGHFACYKCDCELAGSRYVLHGGNPYCVKCYELLFSSTCSTCKELIGIRDKDIAHNGQHWHDKCFYCTECKKSLIDQQFALESSTLYCGDCHDEKFAPRCDKCNDVFKGGMKKFEYAGRKWHEQCFCCDECQKPIEDKSFVPQDERAICVVCYEHNYAPRCTQCNGPIVKCGVTYRDLPWHKDCFTCANCNKVLAGEKFTTHDEKPYCGDCYSELFAKKCQECTRPITGLGTTKFVSFEEHHWHTDCFVCRQCRTSLVGKGFLLNDGVILCPECDQ